VWEEPAEATEERSDDFIWGVSAASEQTPAEPTPIHAAADDDSRAGDVEDEVQASGASYELTAWPEAVAVHESSNGPVEIESPAAAGPGSQGALHVGDDGAAEEGPEASVAPETDHAAERSEVTPRTVLESGRELGLEPHAFETADRDEEDSGADRGVPLTDADPSPRTAVVAEPDPTPTSPAAGQVASAVQSGD
jgi:hypothetical protein